MALSNICGVQFQRAGRIYDYRYDNHINLKVGDQVLVQYIRDSVRSSKDNKEKLDKNSSTAKDYRLGRVSILKFEHSLVIQKDLDKTAKDLEVSLESHMPSQLSVTIDSSNKTEINDKKNQDDQEDSSQFIKNTKSNQTDLDLPASQPHSFEHKTLNLPKIIRKALNKDLNTLGYPGDQQTFDIVNSIVKELKLKIKLIKCDFQLGSKKVVVYFSAPSRIDFRELVKKMALKLKLRIELRQIGARDETKLLGGIGICGREYCCSSFLREFIPISIKMAKNQNLALNPVKVSGGCGRLLCCLTYENDLYVELKSKLPNIGTEIKSSLLAQPAVVIQQDIFNQKVVVKTQEGKLESLELRQIDSDSSGENLKNNTRLSSKKIEQKQQRQQSKKFDTWGDDLDIVSLMEYQQLQKSQKPVKKSPNNK